MRIVSTSMTVADYCEAMDRGEILVNRHYQRSDKVWPTAARSFLIETILLDYPMPKLSLYQLVDVTSKKSYKEIVDGQQRSLAISDFYKDSLRLSNSLDTSEIAGKIYSELPESHKRAFLDYALSVDLFVSASPEDVREVFRRMNSYTIPLNPEEQRHATFQGAFKWFINRLSKQFDGVFVRTGLFTEKQLVRMADTKLLAELCHAILNGIQTTNKVALDRLYKSKDQAFPEENMLTQRLTAAADQLLEWEALHNSVMMKPYIAYSLLLAITHVQAPASSLEGTFATPRGQPSDAESILTNLTSLGDAVENASIEGEYREFVLACQTKTNVRNQRSTRFRWLCRAIVEPSL